MKVQSFFFPTAAAVFVVVACGTTNSGGPSNSAAGTSSSMGGNGSSAAGSANGAAGAGTGNGGTASTTSCDNVTACGGNAVGTWTVSSSCLKVSGQLDVQTVFGLTCPSGQVTGSLQVTGTWTGNADGTFTDNTITTGTEQLSLPVECLTLSMAKVTCQRLADVMSGGYYDTVTCTDAASGGCSCSATVKQSGSIGHTSTDPQKTGNYTTASNAITITQDNSSYSYCAANNKLTLSPQGTNPTTTGTIVLQSGSSSGSGGSSAGGAGGSGGVTSTAGAGGSGAGAGGSGAGAGGGGSMTRGRGPCDIYSGSNTPCAAAYSMVRALSSTYNGFLYQVRNMSSSTNTGTGGTTKDIGMTADGYADSAAQDTFCSGSTCTVSKLYDQSGNGNDLVRGSAGPAGNGARSGNDDYESTANKLSVTAGGHKVYALYMAQFEGYRTVLKTTAKGVPLGNKDQGIYELVDGTHFGTQCCWDFGSVSPDPNVYVTMNTLFFGKGFWGAGAGVAPWFMGDFEGGVWAGGTGASTVVNPSNPSMAGVNFALGILHTPVGKYALRMADVQTASDLATAYDGAIVSGKTWGNAGGITLGVGGDNSNNSFGTFYEGVLTSGSPSNATDLLIMKNIQAVGYKK
jgi:non-reducing end alpha-L-arabinofuranosidase